MTRQSSLAVVEGSTDQPLWFKTLPDIVNERAAEFEDKPLAIFPWQGVCMSYRELADRSQLVASGLRQIGIQYGDCVGVMAGNRHEYLEVVTGSALIGCPVLVLNNTYKPWEMSNCLKKTSCRVLFIAPIIGCRNLDEHIQLLMSPSKCADRPNMSHIITLGGTERPKLSGVRRYEEFTSGMKTFSSMAALESSQVPEPTDIVSFQFTSGTTGEPKASMSTHINFLNNARFLGQRMHLRPEDIVCCPPPLFHCFGLVMGFLSVLIHGATIVFPSDHFDAGRVLDAVNQERCTTLLGVPTMFAAELELIESKGYSVTSLRKGLVAGSPVFPSMMDSLQKHMGIEDMVISYGMTETGPITFCTTLEDSTRYRATTVGKVMPHIAARVVDAKGRVLLRGERGELCISGYALHKGYLNNQVKTDEVMTVAEDGAVWMHTGDECLIDDDGYCQVLGRIKDIIIRGGENIYPKEIEEHLQQHPDITEASVVGVPDTKYGEVVACFLRAVDEDRAPDVEDVRGWVQKKMGRSKTPQYVFWVGSKQACSHIPQTGSGKHQKNLLRDIASKLLKRSGDFSA